MKTTINTKQSIRSFLVLMCCLFLAQATFAQTAPITLTFSGRDAASGNIVPLQSVMVSNLTQGGDTTVYGDAPTLILQETYGIFELNKGQNASFSLEPNFPNPFTGTTTVSLRLQNRQSLKLTLFDQQGAVATRLEQEFSRGAHHFEVAVPQNKLYLLSVSDGTASQTLKLFSTAGNTSRIAYTGQDENTILKTGTETTTFTFQPGDMLEYTVNAAGYYEYTTFDNPTENTDYVFDLQANTTELPPTVTTATVTNITATSATCGGNVSDQGSAAVTTRGVCWSTSPGPTIANSHTTDGSGTGVFTSAITGLAESTSYYARAYATNQFGTAYGNEVSFATSVMEPVFVCDSVFGYSTTGKQYKTTYTRNAQEWLLIRLLEIWQTNHWVNHLKHIYAYDTFGNELTSLSQNWDTSYGTWVNDRKYSSTYDASENIISWLIQCWNTGIGNWTNYSKDNFTYDASGNRISYIRQNWDGEIGNWVNNWKHSYTYDETGIMLSYLNQDWDTNIGNWVNSRKYVFIYDATGNRLSYLCQNWDAEYATWVNGWKRTYTYDASGNRLLELRMDWDNNSSSWLNDGKYEYQYDYVTKKIITMYYEWSGGWIPADGYHSVYMFDYNLFSDGSYYKTELYYSSYLSALGDMTDSGNINNNFFHPTPATGTVSVNNPLGNNASLKVFNMTGKQVKETTLNPGQNNTSVQNLP